jgi:group I intron endonuclease
VGKKKRFLNGELGGIYCFTNKINGKKYIGQTINWPARKYEYESNKGNRFINKAIKKYGIQNFSFRVLNYASIGSYLKNSKNQILKHPSGRNMTVLDRLEDFYIKKYKTQIPNGYKVLSGGVWSGNPIVTNISKLSEKRREIYLILLFDRYRNTFINKIKEFSEYIKEEDIKDIEQDIWVGIVEATKKGKKYYERSIGTTIRNEIFGRLIKYDFPIGFIFTSLQVGNDITYIKDEIKVKNSLFVVEKTISAFDNEKEEEISLIRKRLFEMTEKERFLIGRKYGLFGFPEIKMDELKTLFNNRFKTNYSEDEVKNRFWNALRKLRVELLGDEYGR